MRTSLILILGSFFFVALVPSTVFAHSRAQGETVIHMTSNGFEPSAVKITRGETITFENVDNQSHWPAGNTHPTHRLYPGSDIKKCGSEEEGNIFDACHSIEPGESYSFTFNKPGVWRFHDHLLPAKNAYVTVLINWLEILF